MSNILAEIELTDKQVRAFNEELSNWKTNKAGQIEEQLRSELQTEYEVKVRQLKEDKKQFMAQQESLVEEIKGKMQQVMVKRFTTAIKEMYDQLKVEARKDAMNDPRITALDEVKNIIFPLMDETVTKGYVDELANSLKMIESREEEIDRLRARLKLKEITGTLSPTVAEAVEAFIGEPMSEEEVVEKYAKLKNLVKTSASPVSEGLDTIMEKVRAGESLSKSERKHLGVALDAMRDDDDDEVNTTLDRIMQKVGKGENLNKKEEKLLSKALMYAEGLDEEGDGDARDYADYDEDDDEDYSHRRKKGKKKNEARKSKKDMDYEDDEDEDEDDEDDDDDDMEEAYKKSKKSKKGYDYDEEDDEEEEDMEEDLEIKPSFSMNRPEKNAKVNNDYLGTLNEMLNLAGVPKE